ncbi:Signal recognition particle 19 kDa protein [Halovivax asiaticus JCM 14624]|uniref:Signal recognition particle 19 kDa protein n=1 Tax=Halovivax asiaticus JCM 14624 TaxID=1227490 RepID=M0BV75_9EURY|nr:signal recognition particle subunit SRP19 [Halovivax asiaticus]ELZ13539.1 Signal recognition particle 19 kDa protein [Halovivax asiaticus JCM 14624]
MVENVIWPAYLDAERTRREGRRVPHELAVSEPTVDEIAKAVQQVGYDATVERDKTYSREPWRTRGRVVVRGAEDSTKNDLVQAVAAYVGAMRS